MTPKATKAGFMGIMLRTALLSWLVTAATMSIFLLVIIPQQKATYLEALDSKAHSVTVSLRDVAVSALVSGDYVAVVDHCNGMLKGDRSVAYLVLTRMDGYSFFHEPSGWRTENLSGPWRPAQRLAVSGLGRVPPVSGRLFHSSEPLNYSGVEWGWIHVGLSPEAYDRSLTRAYQRIGLLAIFCAGFSLVASLLFARRLVNPIRTLQALVRQISEGDFSARAPVACQDEVGRLAQSVNTMADALQHRDSILESVRFAAQQFLGAPDWQGLVPDVLARIGQAAGASRAYILECGGGSAIGQEFFVRHVWTAPGVSPASHHPVFQAERGANPDFERWTGQLRRGEVVTVRAGDLPDHQRSLFLHDSIKSLILIPICDERSWWGCLGFDDCGQERPWTEAERHTFRAAADILGAAQARQRAQDGLIEANEQLQKEVGERQLVQEALRSSEERFSQAFRASPIPLAIQNLEDERFVDANESFAELTGRISEEIWGRSAVELNLFADPEARLGLMGSLRGNEVVRQRQCQFLTKQGKGRDVLLTMEVFSLGNQPHVLLVAHDITERLALEQQLRQAQKMEAVGQLAAGVAHDFNNILTVIQGHAGLTMANPNLSRQTTESLREISEAADRAAGLTRQLLAFSRKQIIQRRVLGVNDVLRNLTKMLGRLVGEDIALQWTFGEPLPCVLADVGCLEQVMVNLAANARDAMPHGGRLHIESSAVEVDEGAARAHPDRRPGRFVCVRVEDTGYGMAPEVMSRIFEPFFTTKDVGKGTGLGLASVYGILKQHEGWIEVASALGQGTTFRFYLPASKEQTESQRAAVSRTLLPRGAGESILLVEDEPAVRDMAGQLLQRHGYAVRSAGSGAEALQVWEDHGGRFDLVLTDLVMPEGMSGQALAQLLRANAPQLPIIYMSGYSLKLADDEMVKQNRIPFLQKPFSLPQLLETVHSSLKHAKPANG